MGAINKKQREQNVNLEHVKILPQVNFYIFINFKTNYI